LQCKRRAQKKSIPVNSAKHSGRDYRIRMQGLGRTREGSYSTLAWMHEMQKDYSNNCRSEAEPGYMQHWSGAARKAACGTSGRKW
jgi:hypothetical protein